MDGWMDGLPKNPVDPVEWHPEDLRPSTADEALEALVMILWMPSLWWRNGALL